MNRTYWKEHPYVNVGIMEAAEISFAFTGTFITEEGTHATGEQKATLVDGCIKWNGKAYKEITFSPQGENAVFQLNDVVIGIDYHWERKEQQTFPGSLKLLVDGQKIVAINHTYIEDYLYSVICSEMRATASVEFLKAAAIISRSWLLKQIENRMKGHAKEISSNERINTEDEILTWSDQDDHSLFDVCADDHCQRYQGIQKASSENVRQAIDQTIGMILTSEDEICDARFYKCCGGVTEAYETCWDNQHISYLTAVSDNVPGELDVPNLAIEEEAEKWIRSNPPALCNTQDKEILSQVLNDYDLETPDFYRWKREYTQEELRNLIEKKTNKEFGNILDLQPLQRGPSGRIYRMRIVGEKRSFIVGKELEIRRVLSTNHLYSSAFVVDKEDIKDGVPQHFTITGAGWGHGVGLCQIGAAVMGAKGFAYDKILLHYYQGANIEKIY